MINKFMNISWASLLLCPLLWSGTAHSMDVQTGVESEIESAGKEILAYARENFCTFDTDSNSILGCHLDDGFSIWRYGDKDARQQLSFEKHYSNEEDSVSAFLPLKRSITKKYPPKSIIENVSDGEKSESTGDSEYSCNHRLGRSSIFEYETGHGGESYVISIKRFSGTQSKCFRYGNLVRDIKPDPYIYIMVERRTSNPF